MNGKLSARDIAYIAMGAALIAVCAWISIPLPPPLVPFTLQLFAVCLVCGVLGLKRGLWSVLTYILLGAAGVPVFSGFRGGVGVLLGAAGGYIVGWTFTALLIGSAAEKFGRKAPLLMLFMELGVLVCYVFGTAWFMLVYSRSSGPIGILAALSMCVLPYIIPDAVKVVLAGLLSGRLHRLIDRRNGT